LEVATLQPLQTEVLRTWLLAQDPVQILELITRVHNVHLCCLYGQG